MAENNNKRESYSPFKTAICTYLAGLAKQDKEFLQKLKNPEKNIDKCLEYIVSEVRKCGREGFCDDEIYSLAVHYYDEPNDKLPLSKLPNMDDVKVVVNVEMPFTDEEKKKAREKAFEELVADEKKKLKGGSNKKSSTASTSKTEDDAPSATQMSLF